MNHCIYCHHWSPLDRELVEEGEGLQGKCQRPDIREWVRLIFVRERTEGESDAALQAFGALLDDYECHIVTNARYGCVAWEGEDHAE